MAHFVKNSPQFKRTLKPLTHKELVEKLDQMDTTDPFKLVEEVKVKFDTKHSAKRRSR